MVQDVAMCGTLHDAGTHVHHGTITYISVAKTRAHIDAHAACKTRAHIDAQRLDLCAQHGHQCKKKKKQWTKNTTLRHTRYDIHMIDTYEYF